MQQIDQTTYQALAREHSVEVVVGDEKQPDLLPRVKIKRWDNEVNFSLGLADTNDFVANNTNDKIELQKGNATAHFYELKATDQVAATKIRRTANNERWTAIKAAAEYDVAHKFIEPGTVFIADYVVNEPALALFDMMPADMHVEADNKATAKDYNYSDSSTYKQDDLDWPKYDRLKLVRYTTPYTQFVNPLYMDEGLHHLFVQWHGTKLPNAIFLLMDSVQEVLSKLGVEIKRSDSRSKLYYKHGDRWVKFFSGQPIKDAIGSYINISSSYNKAYDFYKPGTEKDVRDEFAYGLKNGHPEIGHEVINDIVLDFAQRLNLAIEDEPYTAEENRILERAQLQSADTEWILSGKRNDANWVRQRPIDGFEFEVTYSSNPASNEIRLTGNVPKNVVATVQAELPGTEQIEQKIFRPATAYRSIAIYHTEESGNKYRTGKVSHIYRPIAHDATGDAVFCEFKELIDLPDGTEYDLSKGLTITVPQDFLDNAAYPVTVDPTFGYTSSGASSIVLADTIIGIQAASSTYTKVSAIGSYFSDPDGSYASTDNFQGALYEVAGVFPANWRFIGHTLSYTNTSGNASGHDGLQFINFDKFQPIKASTSYYICAWGNVINDPYGGTININYDTATGSNTMTKSQSFTQDVWPTSLSGATAIASNIGTSRKYSLYAITGNTFPIISATSTAALGTDSYNVFAAANSRAWSATNNYDSVMPISDLYFYDFYVQAETAPGAGGSGISRLNYMAISGSPSSLAASFSEATSSGSDVYGGIAGAAGTNISFFSQVTGGTAATTRFKWRLAYSAVNQILLSSTAQLTSNSATRYLGIDAGLLSTTSTINQVMPAGGTLQNMYVQASVPLTGAGSYAVSLIQNSSSVASVTLNSSNQFATTILAGSGISVSAGDLLYYQITPTSTPTSASIGMGMEFSPTDASTGVMLGGGNSSVSTASTTYSNWHDGTWATTEANVQALSYDMVVTAFYVKLGAAPGTGKSRTITLRCNATNTPVTITISDANTAGSWTGRFQLTRDQLINVAHSSSGTPAASTVTYGMAFVSTIDPTSDSMLSMGVG